MDSSRKLRWLIIGLLISNAVLVAFLVFGHPSFQRPPSPREVLIERLQLSAAQVEDYQKLIELHQAQVQELDIRINETKKKLYQGLTMPAEDESTLLGQLAILQTEAEETKLDHFRAIKQLCTPEQLPKFEALTEDLGKVFSRARPQRLNGNDPR